MSTVKDILDCLHSYAPPYMKESWDNVGLLCGDPHHPVSKVLVALDPFEGVCREACDIGADLIVTHHPLIFQAPKSVTTQTSIGRSIMLLCANGISAINAHTNLDCTPGGVNDILAQALELNEVSVINPSGTDDDGNPWGLLRMGRFEAELPAFLEHVKRKLGTPTLRMSAQESPCAKWL